MKTKKIPMRKCVITNESFEKSLLIRIVVTKDGNVSVDLTGKSPGRGAYLHLNEQNIKKAIKSNKIAKSLKCDIPNEIYDELLKLCDIK